MQYAQRRKHNFIQINYLMEISNKGENEFREFCHCLTSTQLEVEALVVCAGPTNSVLCPAGHALHVHRVRVLPLVPKAAQETARCAYWRVEPQEARRICLDDAQRLSDERSLPTAAGGARTRRLRPTRTETRRLRQRRVRTRRSAREE